MCSARFLLCVAAVGAAASSARADRFSRYGPPDNPFVIAKLPSIGPGSYGTVFDVLADGRLIAVTGNDVYRETAPFSNTYHVVAHLDPTETGGSVDPAFVRVSPGGGRIAVGGGFGKPVAVFDATELGSPGSPTTLLSTSAGGNTRYYGVEHFDAEWFDDARLALTAGTFGSDARVTLLNTTCSTFANVNPTIIDGIDGASAGIAFDAAGRLYTGNGFDNSPGVPGTSETGTIRAFELKHWQAAIGTTPLDFETEGTFVAELLSASSLGFDGEGNLYVGGGDFSDPASSGYFAIIEDQALADALAGIDPITLGDETEIRVFDPEGSGFTFYAVNANPLTGELYGSWPGGFGPGDLVFIARTEGTLHDFQAHRQQALRRQ